MRLSDNFAIWDECVCGCGEKVFVEIKTNPFQWRWFMDSGDWFCYFHIYKHYWRFSSAGFIHGKLE